MELRSTKGDLAPDKRGGPSRSMGRDDEPAGPDDDSPGPDTGIDTERECWDGPTAAEGDLRALGDRSRLTTTDLADGSRLVGEVTTTTSCSATGSCLRDGGATAAATPDSNGN